MRFSTLDWIILGVLYAFLMVSGWLCRRFMTGVASFLVAGRSLGRYLGLGADAMQGLGAITVIAYWQMTYGSGLAGQWWYMLIPFTGMVVAFLGWGICRVRETRAMTLGQLIEMRYSKRLRILCGTLCYVSGIVNMGIFPAASAGFFVTFCGLPTHVSVLGFQMSTMVLTMLVLEGAAVCLALWGGQVSIVVTDFFQSVFVNLVFVLIMFALYRMVTWDQLASAYLSQPNGEGMINPFYQGKTGDFNKWFFMMWMFMAFYNVVSWAPNTSMISSTRTAHEARMMRFLLSVKNFATMGMGIWLLPLGAYVLLHHLQFADQAQAINGTLSQFANDQMRSQMTTPAAVVHILPMGLLGALAALMLFASVTTDDTYLLTWGGMLVQDVIIPLRGKPLSPKQHINLIRASVIGVAGFVILFSLFFSQVDNIIMFMFLSGALFQAGAGIVLLAGLYWKRGTTAAAWATMLTGAVVSVAAFSYRMFHKDWYDGQTIAFFIAVMCVVVYVVVSLLDRKPAFVLDVMLNRRQPGQDPAGVLRKSWWRRWNEDIPAGDRVFLALAAGLIVLILGSFAAVSYYNLKHPVLTQSWFKFWRIYLVVMFTWGTVFMLWISIGGFRDLRRLFRDLRAQAANEHDDGSVVDHQAAH